MIQIILARWVNYLRRPMDRCTFRNKLGKIIIGIFHPDHLPP
jgi:hypothetical protein